MIGMFSRWRARRRHERQLALCKQFGHSMTRSGELTPAKEVGGVSVPTGPAEFWIFSCKCGYSEVNDVGLGSYVRSYADGEKLKEEQGGHHG